MAGSPRTRQALGVAGAALLLPILGITLFSATGRDDSHITFWAADALADTGSLINYNGERIEQSSSLLLTLLLAASRLISVGTTPEVALVLGIAAGAGSVVLAWRLAEDIQPGAGWIAGVLTATAAYLVYWSLSGMETSLAALTAVWFAVSGGRYLDERAPAAPAVFAAGAWVFVRPEGIAVVLAALLASTILAPGTRRQAGVLAATSVVAAAAVTGWRLLFFGVPFPQPVMAKIGGLGLGPGLRYVWDWTTPAVIALAVFAVLGLVAHRRRGSATLAAGIVAAQVAFTIAAGGDWMEGGRMLVPLFPALSAVAAVGLRPARMTPLLAGLLVLANLGALGWVARSVSTGRPLWASSPVGEEWSWPERRNRIHQRDALFLPELQETLAALDAGLDRTVLYASKQAGMLPYHALAEKGNVRFVDRWALTTRRDPACDQHAEPATAYGRELTYTAWAGATDACGRLPDVVVELGSAASLPPGYTVVHREPAIGPATVELLPGRPIRAGEFVAVRDQHLGLLDGG